MLSGKRAVVTGGSDGIGLGIAKAFAQNGASVLLVARDEGKLRKSATALSENPMMFQGLPCCSYQNKRVGLPERSCPLMAD